MKKIVSWILRNRLEVGVFCLIILIASVLRFYKLDQYMTFLGDEGRDALIVKKILVEHDFPLLGPPMSVGNLYLGPLYYYMMSVAMLPFWLNPVAAAGMVALIGTLTVALVYYLTREWFGKWPAALASILYAVSPVTIIYSRSSWNPDPLPFFALLSILGLYKTHKSGNMLWLVLTGGSLAFAIQMHYLGLILVPICGVLYLYEILLDKRKKLVRKNKVLGTVLALLLFGFLMSPLVIFDFKYNFQNWRAFEQNFLISDKAVGGNPFESLVRIWPIYFQNLIGRYMTGQMFPISVFVSILVLVPLVFSVMMKFKGKALSWPILVLGVWLGLGVLGLSFYKNEIYDHYLGFLNPVPFILYGSLVYFCLKYEKKVWRWTSLGFVTGLFVFMLLINSYNSPLRVQPNNQLQRTSEIANFIIEQTEGRPYNFALIAERNYDSAYQFLLEQQGAKPGQIPFTMTDQLFVVCEDKICQPLGHQKYEIAGFGQADQVWEKEFEGVKIFKLVPKKQ